MKYYTVKVPTRPHLYRYITTQEGNPIYMNADSLFCILLNACLTNAPSSGLSREAKRIRIASFSENIEVKIPMSNFYRYGFHLSQHHIVILNRHLEKSFEKDLSVYCSNYIQESKRYCGYKEAYESFAEKHNIRLEIDIRYDTLKKMEYRARKGKKRRESLLS